VVVPLRLSADHLAALLALLFHEEVSGLIQAGNYPQFHRLFVNGKHFALIRKMAERKEGASLLETE